MNKSIGVFIVALFILGVSARSFWTAREEASKAKRLAEKCSALCDPFVVESCGKDARTATCKTTKGYAVRMMDENGKIKTEM